nr:S6 family peptidase [Escherichia coli]
MLSRLLLASGAVAGVLFSSPALASVVGNTLPWQTYRDFAENKGRFMLGPQIFRFMVRMGLSVGGWTRLR